MKLLGSFKVFRAIEMVGAQLFEGNFASTALSVLVDRIHLGNNLIKNQSNLSSKNL